MKRVVVTDTIFCADVALPEATEVGEKLAILYWRRNWVRDTIWLGVSS